MRMSRISRRKFISTAGKGLLISALTAPTSAFAYGTYKNEEQLRVGIIGAENSHTRAFGKLFNIDKAFPGVRVTHVWGETVAFARDAMKRGGIPEMVEDPLEMIGRIDALIVDHRHGKYHLPAALPFIKAGIPVFIDKPFCYRLEKGREFLARARELDVPVTSYSSIAHSAATFDMREQVMQVEDLAQVVMYGPLDPSSEYGGVFFYGPHLVEPMIYLFGTDVEKVRMINNGSNSGASLVYRNGMLVTYVFTTKKYGWQTFIETSDGIRELKSRVEKHSPALNYTDMVTMFRTGKEPRSHESILAGVAILEAMERSAASDHWEYVEQV